MIEMPPVECFLVQPPADPSGEFVRVNTGEAIGYRRDLQPGAMWEAPWMGDKYRVNGDGPVWVILLPNGNEFLPGSRSSNCTRIDEDHDCWCVHGEAPRLTVNKTPEPGRTSCIAGGGSISSGKGDHNWHGFLRDGKLVPA